MGLADNLRKLIGQAKSAERLPGPSGVPIGFRVDYPNRSGYITKATRGYKANPIVAACVGLMQSTMNEPPLGVLDPQTGGVNLNHPIAITFRRPNPYMGQAQFWGMVWFFLSVSGNAYIRKIRGAAGNISGFVVYSDAHVVPILNRDGWVGQYLYKDNSIEETWQASEVIHLRNPLYTDPLKLYMGMSPIEVCWDKVQTYIELQNTIYSLAASNGVVSGILTAPAEVPSAQVASLKQQLQKRRDASGKERTEPLVLGNGMTYVAMGLDASKMQAGETLRDLEAAICASFRIHPSVIGSTAGLAVSTYNNLQSAYAEFTTLTRVPLWNAIEEQLESGLAPEYPGLQLGFDLTQVQALQPDVDRVIYPVIAQYNANLITQNETRAKLGYDLVEDGDVYSVDRAAPMLPGGIMSAPTDSNATTAPEEGKAGEAIDPIESTDGGRIKWVEPEAVKYWQAQERIIESAAKETARQALDMIEAARRGALSKVKAPQDGVTIDALVKQFMKANAKTREKLARQIIELTIANMDGVDLATVQSDIDQITDLQTRETEAMIKTSCESLKNDVARIAEANAGNVDAMREALTGRFDAIGPSRAATIARTTCRAQATVVQNETVSGLNRRQADPNKRFVNVWLSERDDAVRESHEELDGLWIETGQSWEIHQPGITKGPGIGTDPGETINCRCVIRPTRYDKAPKR